MTKHNDTSGFTLIELMIVVLILGIIVAIAFPAYTNQVQKTRRAEATSTLLNLAQQLERCYTRNNSYDDCIPDDELTFESENGFYEIVVAPDALTYSVTATPMGSQTSDRCQLFTLTHTGNRTANPSREECWRQ